MVANLDWEHSYRVVDSRYPFTGLFDEIVDPADLDAILAIEGRTNERIRDEIGDLSLVRSKDRISGPGATPIMAAFTHAKESRFSDGGFGIYYAAYTLESALHETIWHKECFLRATHEESTDVDMRAYLACIKGSFDDIRSLSLDDALYDIRSYDASRRYGVSLYDADEVDGIAYRSVRDPQRGECVACFRPRCISDCTTSGYYVYRWNGIRQKIVGVESRGFLTDFPSLPL